MVTKRGSIPTGKATSVSGHLRHWQLAERLIRTASKIGSNAGSMYAKKSLQLEFRLSGHCRPFEVLGRLANK